MTLGGTGKQRGKRHPTLEDHVVVGVGAVVLGAITVGEGAKIGGGAVVVKDVPPHSTAVGVPARIVVTRDPRTGATRRVEDLPDPRANAARPARQGAGAGGAHDRGRAERPTCTIWSITWPSTRCPTQLWAALGENGHEGR